MEASINSALCKGYYQQVRFLVDQGYDVNERERKDGRTPLINCALVEEVSWSVGMARNLIENGALVRLRDSKGLNAIHYACIFNRLELVKVFLSAIDFDLNQGDKQGNTALHYVVAANNGELLKLLLQAHVRYNVTVDKANARGVTALLEAYRGDHLNCVELLVDAGGADDMAPEVVEFKMAKRSGSVSTSSSSSVEGENERPMTAARYSRARSAPLLKKRRRTALSVTSSSGESDENMALLAREKLVDKVHRSASANNLHNRPDYILQISPLDYFSRRGHGPRPMTAVHRDRPVSSWRVEMKGLYTTFDFQFTSSYRKAAKPPPEDIQLQSLNAPSSEFPVRSISPNPSECPSDTASIMSRRSHRRASFQKSSLDIKRVAKVANSLQTGRDRRLSQHAHSDSSSTESVNSSNKKRSSIEGKDDPESPRMDKQDRASKPQRPASSKTVRSRSSTSSEDSGTGEQPPRPHSRSGHYHAPAGKESTSEKQLHIIKE